jgi:hypothetical protein
LFYLVKSDLSFYVNTKIMRGRCQIRFSLLLLLKGPVPSMIQRDKDQILISSFCTGTEESFACPYRLLPIGTQHQVDDEDKLGPEQTRAHGSLCAATTALSSSALSLAPAWPPVSRPQQPRHTDRIVARNKEQAVNFQGC